VDNPEVPPAIEIVQGQSIELDPGESVNLTCKVLDGYPVPEVAWFQFGSRLQEYTIVPALQYNIENVLESTSLECRVRKGFSWKYDRICTFYYETMFKATNAKGGHNATISIEVTGPGGAPGQIQYRVDGTDVEISWGQPPFPNGEIKVWNINL